MAYRAITAQAMDCLQAVILDTADKHAWSQADFERSREAFERVRSRLTREEWEKYKGARDVLEDAYQRVFGDERHRKRAASRSPETRKERRRDERR